MTQLKLSDVKVGKAQKPSRWDNKTQSQIELDPFEVFVNQLSDKKYDWKTKTTSQSLFFRKAVMPEDACMYHNNYMEYLEKCWADHLGIVIQPDFIWFTLLSELASMTKKAPESYRHLFSESEEKQEIVIVTAEMIDMPLNQLIASLRSYVPTDIKTFMPEFTTTSSRSRHAMYSVFCDMCSPYYNYGMLMCGFPAITVQGTKDDWQLMANQWGEITKTFDTNNTWFNKVKDILDNCASKLSDEDWWREMFKLEQCGSGHQTEVTGWFTELFIEQPKGPRYVGNFPTSVGVVEYKQLNANKEYKMQDGIFWSYQEGDFMMPDFGYTIHEKVKA